MTFRRKGCFSSHQTNRLVKPWTLLGGLTLKNLASWTSRLPARKHVVQLPIICDRKVSTPETLWHHHIPQGHFPAMSTDISRAMDNLQFPTPCSRTPFEEIMLKVWWIIFLVFLFLPFSRFCIRIFCLYPWCVHHCPLVSSMVQVSGMPWSATALPPRMATALKQIANELFDTEFRLTKSFESFNQKKLPWNFERCCF